MLRLAFPSLMILISILYPPKKIEADHSTVNECLPASDLSAIEILCRQIGETELPITAFRAAMNVYEALAAEGQIMNRNILTLIDFSQPSDMERLFVIDLKRKKILFKSLVAHGKNSGENFATSFSNGIQSHQSSLGFYLTGKTYQGRHGYSLTLKGLEKGINDNAWDRSVVIHGAEYVSREYIDTHGRLGRSFGCPALPLETSSAIIDTIRDGSLLFIYAKDEDYGRNSRFFNSLLSNP